MTGHEELLDIIQTSPGIDFQTLMDKLIGKGIMCTVDGVRKQLNTMIKYKMIYKKYEENPRPKGRGMILKYYPRND